MSTEEVSDSCPICLSGFHAECQHEECTECANIATWRASVQPCNHHVDYHRGCLEEWLFPDNRRLTKNDCPLCRKPVSSIFGVRGSETWRREIPRNSRPILQRMPGYSRLRSRNVAAIPGPMQSGGPVQPTPAIQAAGIIEPDGPIPPTPVIQSIRRTQVDSRSVVSNIAPALATLSAVAHSEPIVVQNFAVAYESRVFAAQFAEIQQSRRRLYQASWRVLQERRRSIEQFIEVQSRRYRELCEQYQELREEDQGLYEQYQELREQYQELREQYQELCEEARTSLWEVQQSIARVEQSLSMLEQSSHGAEDELSEANVPAMVEDREDFADVDEPADPQDPPNQDPAGGNVVVILE